MYLFVSLSPSHVRICIGINVRLREREREREYFCFRHPSNLFSLNDYYSAIHSFIIFRPKNVHHKLLLCNSATCTTSAHNYLKIFILMSCLIGICVFSHCGSVIRTHALDIIGREAKMLPLRPSSFEIKFCPFNSKLKFTKAQTPGISSGGWDGKKNRAHFPWGLQFESNQLEEHSFEKCLCKNWSLFALTDMDNLQTPMMALRNGANLINIIEWNPAY